MRIKFILIITLTLFACNNSKSKQQIISNDTPVIKIKISDADFAKIDSDLIIRLNKRLDSADVKEKDFIHNMLVLIDKFKDKKLDTIVNTIGNIAGDKLIDTIQTRIYYKNKIVWVQYNWIKKQDTLWRFQLKDPYLFVGNSDLYIDNRSAWEVFTVAVFRVTPKIIKFNDYKNLIEMSLMQLDYTNKEEGLQIDKNNYKNYLQSFKGSLIEWGDNWYSEGLYIWYAPKKRLISFYKP